jgi:hypothetical protein
MYGLLNIFETLYSELQKPRYQKGTAVRRKQENSPEQIRALLRPQIM